MKVYCQCYLKKNKNLEFIVTIENKRYVKMYDKNED